MLKKTLITIISINLLLFIWQSVLGITLSTKGDILNDQLFLAAQIQNQIDSLENQIAQNGNLDRVGQISTKKGFIVAKIIHLSSDILANAKKN